jgi:hypothetical protein
MELRQRALNALTADSLRKVEQTVALAAAALPIALARSRLYK